MESGNLGSSSMQIVNRVTNVKIDYNVPRTNVYELGRGKPLQQRPIINYIPVDVSIDLLKSDNSLEQMLGLVNPTGIAALITDTNPQTATLGIRSMQVYFAPTSSANYNGMFGINSGVLTSYSLQGGISELVRQTVALQFLDYSGSVNLTPRATTNITTAGVKPEGQQLTGLSITGLGLTGFTAQSFSLSVNFSRAQIFQLGTKFPVQRPFTDIAATLQVQGFFEGVNNSITGLSAISDCGNPQFGTVALTLMPSCATTSPTTITIGNPYVDSCSINGQVNNFSTAAFSFSIPLGPNPLETGDGSTLFIS